MGKTIDSGKTDPRLMKQHSKSRKPSEWVGAPVAPTLCERKKGGVKETVTPSDRVLCSHTQTKFDEGQATDVKFTTDNAIGSMMKPDYHEAKPIRIKNSKALVDRTTNRKMPSFSQPDLPHRAVQNLNSVQLPPSLDGGLSFDISSTDYCHLTHPSRVSNSTKIARTMNTRINFPASNDKIWKKIDEELELLIPKLFNKRLINKLTTSELSQKFDSWLHQFF